LLGLALEDEDRGDMINFSLLPVSADFLHGLLFNRKDGSGMRNLPPVTTVSCLVYS
jgi:hypothetical protein